MSDAQRFLVEACRIVGQGRYFRWQTVGSTLGFSAAESQRVMESLNARKLVVLLHDGDARLLDAGRRLASGQRAPAPVSSPARSRPERSPRRGHRE